MGHEHVKTFKRRSFQDLKLSVLSNSSHIIIKKWCVCNRKSSLQYVFSQTASKLSSCNFKLASLTFIFFIHYRLFIGFRHVTFRPDPVEWPFVHVTQIKNRGKTKIPNQVFKAFRMKKYLRQHKDDIISAKVQFHGCFKSFNETSGNILKVLLFLTYILVPGVREGDWRDHEARDFTSCDKLLQENKCNNFQNTENTRWVFSLLLLECQHVGKTFKVNQFSGV